MSSPKHDHNIWGCAPAQQRFTPEATQLPNLVLCERYHIRPSPTESLVFGRWGRHQLPVWCCATTSAAAAEAAAAKSTWYYQRRLYRQLQRHRKCAELWRDKTEADRSDPMKVCKSDVINQTISCIGMLEPTSELHRITAFFIKPWIWRLPSRGKMTRA